MTETPAVVAASEHAAEDGHDEHGHDAHGHGEIHMPPNSWSPISMAFALTLTFVGFITPTGPALCILGLLWVVASGVAWFRAARNEFRELPD
jgi:hypothetical protein